MIYRLKNNIRTRFAGFAGLCFCVLFELLAGITQGADVPQTIATKPIVFTGLRFEPQNVKTGPLVFTGLQFEPQSVKTGSIAFTGLGQETTLGISGSKALFGQKGQKQIDASKTTRFGVKTVKPEGKTKTIPKETLTGFVPLSRNKIENESGKETTKTASVEPDKLGARLVLKDHNVIKSMSLKANESFDLVFTIINTGDTKSGPFQYAVTCKVLRGGPKCPVFNMTRTVYGITPQNTYDIKLKGVANCLGEYEVSVSLKTGQFRSGMIKNVRLNVEAANMSPTPIKSGSTEEDNGKPRIKQISPIKPKQEIEQQQKPSQLREY